MIGMIGKSKISELKKQFEQLKSGRESLLALLEEGELPELVYNSNAIENSTLTLKETERILLELATSRNVSVRELFEAKNLARVIEYIRSKPDLELNKETILLLHRLLLSGIDDGIAGRFRGRREYVRVGTHIAVAPEHIERQLDELLADYLSSDDDYFLERISRFHLEFERIHPFNDGNGRIGRVLLHVQLSQHGYPPIIIRNKGKQDYYYPAFRTHQENNSTKQLDDLLVLSLTESLHKRLAYLRAQQIISLTEYARKSSDSVNTLLNAARRQTIPAFRERGKWKIAL